MGIFYGKGLHVLEVLTIDKRVKQCFSGSGLGLRVKLCLGIHLHPNAQEGLGMAIHPSAVCNCNNLNAHEKGSRINDAMSTLWREYGVFGKNEVALHVQKWTEFQATLKDEKNTLQNMLGFMLLMLKTNRTRRSGGPFGYVCADTDRGKTEQGVRGGLCRKRGGGQGKLQSYAQNLCF